MASSAKVESNGEDEALEDEEVEHFDDFTIASTWERFISEIEAVCRQWMADGPNNLLKKGSTQLEISTNLYKVKSDLKCDNKNYSMEYYFGNSNHGKVVDWELSLHEIQLCFGVQEFLVIAPQSISGVILDSPEASKLLSAVAIALTNCSSFWPAFVPVHDPSRKAYIGIQNMGTTFTRRFEADRVGTQVPIKLMHLEGLYELFVSKFAYSSADIPTNFFKVHFTMKLTFRILLSDDDDIRRADADTIESVQENAIGTHGKVQWDDDCPWTEWYSLEDPVKGFELIASWSEKMVESSLEMAELENSSPHEAKKWILFPILSPNITDNTIGNRVGFSSQLYLLIDALDMSFQAQFMEDFVSVENPGSDNLKSSTVVPPPTVIDRVLKELFHEGKKSPYFAKGEHRNSQAIKAAPVDSLFAQFCLHVLWFGNCNIRAIATLWVEFVREVRWCWEEVQPLPRIPVSSSIDLSTCLINQKLQMAKGVGIVWRSWIQGCISSANFSIIINGRPLDKIIPSRGISWLYASRGSINLLRSFRIVLGARILNLLVMRMMVQFPRTFPLCRCLVKILMGNLTDSMRRGSAGIVGNMMLLNSYQSMHAPFTQDVPLMTEDMHEERLQAVEAFGDSFDFSAQLEKDILSSDMSAFKAANPDGVFEDFIRWHSPGDWEEDSGPEDEDLPHGSATETSKNNWPPRGHLSKRMSEHGNLWRQLWNDAPALPVSEQKSLLDPNREGEKILHYLETLRPHQLLEQMVCTAFNAAADTLSQTSYGGLKLMKTKMEQLYCTMASVLKFLQGNRLSAESEVIDDLRRLCVVFEHVEKLMALAASLYRKLSQAPRLSEMIFKDYYDFYLPRMGTGSSGSKFGTEFNKKQLVRNHERGVISSMFTPPTASQSWRKVLSMGNLFNGHEPILREIVFSLRDRVNGNHYADSTPTAREEEIDTHRMYINGTSNDLRVALSVTSCD
ncbi:rab3 GTPase-activating protein catalytic subunit isoform X2 [Benincasa hispida]|uniref:rab3 GTPase-activating protein catalytic subunit isoform X2 n=1 Tax=Benincasa hispida TaxID=102211 RepID=UPI0019025393|nr:rab3 GTPase-activating protein catalytic subunit isoform X2 [Benincasa hispida]